MAELLIKAVDATHIDPRKDLAGCYKRGDVVVVKPDGHVWGKEEGLPKFVIVKIPGVTEAQAQKYLGPEVNALALEETLTRRLWRVNVDMIPNALLKKLRDTGTVTVTWTQIKGYIQNKATLITEV